MSKMDLIGCRFGRLVASNVVENNKAGTYWHCVCDCGNKKDVFIGHLRAGKIISCGCYLKEIKTTHNKTRTPEHNSWCAMRNRCLSVKSVAYRRYGGSGIKICDRWVDSFENFFNDMGLRPSQKYTLDRKDTRGDYTPDNCVWSSKEDQETNKISSMRYVLNGEVFNSARNAGKRYGVSYTTIIRWCREKRCPKLNIKCDMYSLYG